MGFWHRPIENRDRKNVCLLMFDELPVSWEIQLVLDYFYVSRG